MTPTPLSVIVFAHNQALLLRECLRSVDWAAEIIVIDGDSTDETLRVAREYTKFVHPRPAGGEAEARNNALLLSSTERVLSLSAQEVLTPELKEEIRLLLKNEPACNGFYLPLKHFMGNVWIRYGGFYPAFELRLFRKGKLRDSGVDGSTENLKHDLLRYSYRDFTDAITQLDLQTELEAKQWIRENRKVGVGKMLRKSIGSFWRQYFSQKGHKDGVIGLFMAVQTGMREFLSFAKYWEATRGDR